MLIGPMSKALGQQIVVENVTGAAAPSAPIEVAKAAPDGYSIILRARHACRDRISAEGRALRPTDLEQIGLVNVSRSSWCARKAVPAEHAQGVHRLSERQREEGDRGRRRRRLDLQSRLLGVPFVADVNPTVVSYRARHRRPWTWSPAPSTSAAIRSSTSCRTCKSGALKAYAITGDKLRRCCPTFRPRRKRVFQPSS